jgi:hypothetical protein
MGTKMPIEMDLSDLFQDGQQTIRMTSGTPPKIAAIDFVMVVTGQNSNVSAKTLKRMEEDDTPFWCDLEKFQFPGAGQRPIYVLCSEEAIGLLMMLPGKKAKAFRKESVVLLNRLFAGDPTLHDLIVKNGLSDGIMNQFARTTLASKGQGVEIATVLERRLRDAQMEAEIIRLELSTANSKLHGATEYAEKRRLESTQNEEMIKTSHKNQLLS